MRTETRRQFANDFRTSASKPVGVRELHEHHRIVGKSLGEYFIDGARHLVHFAIVLDRFEESFGRRGFRECGELLEQSRYVAALLILINYRAEGRADVLNWRCHCARNLFAPAWGSQVRSD